MFGEVRASVSAIREERASRRNEERSFSLGGTFLDHLQRFNGTSDDVAASADRGQVARTGAGSFATYMGRWLEHQRSRVGRKTWERYESLARVWIIPRCGRVKLSALRPHHLQATLDAMLAAGAAPASVVQAHRVVTGALRQAVRWQLLPTSPAAGVSPPRAARGKLRIPTLEETKKLVAAGQETPYGLPVHLAA